MADIKPVDPFTGSQQLPTPPNIEDNEATIYNMDRTLPRQVSTGTMRGTQTITGEMRIAQPETGAGIISASGITQNITVSEPLTGLKRILIGKLPDGTWGQWISKPGYDVSKQLNSQSNLISNSNQNMFKIAASGSIPYSFSFAIKGGGTSGSESQSVALDLTNYITSLGLTTWPLIYAYDTSSATDGGIPWSGVFGVSLAANSTEIYSYRVGFGANNIVYFHFIRDWATTPGIGGLGKSGFVKYYIMQEVLPS